MRGLSRKCVCAWTEAITLERNFTSLLAVRAAVLETTGSGSLNIVIKTALKSSSSSRRMRGAAEVTVSLFCF